MKKRAVKFKISAILILGFLIFISGFSLIQAAEYKFEPDYPWEKEKITTLGGSEGLISKFYAYALAAAGVAALGVIIYGGILWTMSGAVSTQAEAREWIRAAISGLALLLFAVLLFRLINPVILQLEDPKDMLDKNSNSNSTSANSGSDSTANDDYIMN